MLRGYSLVLGVALLVPGAIQAQTPAGSPRPGEKGYQTTLRIQENFRRRAKPAAVVVAPTRPAARVAATPAARSFALTVAVPRVSPLTRPARDAVLVAIRGPNNEVRSFPVRGGRAAIQVREVTVRPGETVVIRLVPTALAPRGR